MIESAAKTGPRWRIAILALACAAAGVTASALFLPRQSLWNDEATQLVGITLDPWSQVRWLADYEDHDFGVPDDRMPPLSYWIDWAWSRLFGMGETAMRSLGVVAVGLATLLVFGAGRRAWGTPAGVAAALLLALSPGVVVTSVEIRAYPLFLATSAGLFYCLIRLLDEDEPRPTWWLAAMTAFAVAGCYTHFFGAVAAGGAFLAALILAPRRGVRLGWVVAACVVGGAACLGLAPFVKAAFGITAEDVEPVGTYAVVQLPYRLIFHASMRVIPAAALAGVVGLAASAVAAIAPPSRGRAARLGLVIALASGALVILAAWRVVRFNPFASSYNVWMLPPVALLLGSSLGAVGVWARRLGGLGVAALLAAMLAGDFQLAYRGESFAHTGFALVDDVVRRHGVDQTIVVYDEAANPWHIYSPLRYQYAGKLRQYILKDGPEGSLRFLDFPSKKTEIGLEDLPGECLVLVRWATRTSNEVVNQIRSGYLEIGDGPTAQRLKSSPDWKLVEEGRTLAYVAAEVDVFQRAPAPSASAPASPTIEDAR